MRYDQLPPNLKAKVDAQIGRTPKRARSRATAAGEFQPMRCCGLHGCGAVITSEAALNRHHGGRFDVVLDTPTVVAVASGSPNEETPHA